MCGTIIPYRRRGAEPYPDRGWQTRRMQARSALFDVYGDHLRARGDQAPVAAVVRMLDPVGIAAPAVRTAISRMVMQGWLEPARSTRLRATAPPPRQRAARRGGDPDLPRGRPAWDGRWHLAFVDAPRDRAPRTRLRAELPFLGYAEHAPTTSGSARSRAPRSTRCSTRAGGRAAPRGRGRPRARPGGAWDLDAPAHVVRRLAATGRRPGRRAPRTPRRRGRGGVRGPLPPGPRVAQVPLRRPRPAPRRCSRTTGRATRRRELFASEATRLKPGTDRFVARCLGA